MDQRVQDELNQLIETILDVTEELRRVEEEQIRRPSDVNDCQQAVKQVIARYQTLLDQVDEQERDDVERRYGRRVIQLRRVASWLPTRTAGDSVPLSSSSQWDRASPLPAPSPGPAAKKPRPAPRKRQPRRRPAAGPGVGSEIEAWCGSCKELRMHTILAMVGDEPKQVMCRSCSARHGFRLTPARNSKKAATRPKPANMTQKERDKQRQQEAREALLDELDAATEVREFSKRGRYKAGQIIEHPKHGRGKIEHVVKGSILVRFRGGLKPLDLY